MEASSDININTGAILNVNIGVLGHVDSGKTSLVRSLSTQLSTAALDKNPQSQQRGITLDLGFSAFTLPMPEHLKELTKNEYDYIQFTLVDCPGHASLIKTIIGGAQIIDMVLLVIDANKGIQTQTAECIVIGEITTDNMIIVLNKIDSIPEQDRNMKLERVTNRIKKIFATTKFKDVPLIETSAMIGGEKSIANSTLNVSSSTVSKSQTHHANNNIKNHLAGISTYGIDKLVDLIKSKVKIPDRNYSQPFYYSIDHCFSIKGHGTVLTGTVLSGSVNTSSMIEIPHLQIQRKVKSLQMFRKPVKSAKQGDRVGICVTNLDAELIERSIAAAPGSVPLLHSALCLVKKVRFFKHPCKSMSKFHISVGHNTVIANVVFFGGTRELASFNQNLLTNTNKTSLAINSSGSDYIQVQSSSSSSNTNNSLVITPSIYIQANTTTNLKQSALNACYHRGFPNIDFKFSSIDKHHGTNVSSTEKQQQQQQQDGGYEYQDEILSTEGLIYGTEPLQWALLQFQHSVYCPLGSLIIGSRLDTDTTTTTADGGTSNNTAAHQCRLAFYGPIKATLNGDDDLPRTGIYVWKTKICEVFRIQDVTKAGLCMEAIIWKLVTGNSNINLYLGLQVETECGQLGNIISSFGADGKCRVKFSIGAILKVGTKLKFRYKKYIFDKNRTTLDQTGLIQLRSTEPQLYYPEVNIINNNIDNNSSVINTNMIKSTNMKKSSNHSNNNITKDILINNKSNLNSEVNVNNSIKNVTILTDMLDNINVSNVIPEISNINKSNHILLDVVTKNINNDNDISKETSVTCNRLQDIISDNNKTDIIISDTVPNNNNNNVTTNVTNVNSEQNKNILESNGDNTNTTIEIISEQNKNILESNGDNTNTTIEIISEQNKNILESNGDNTNIVNNLEYENMLLKYDIRKGTIESIKSDAVVDSNSENIPTDYYIAIVKGAFRMEENIRKYIGSNVYIAISDSTLETSRRSLQTPIGELIGPFGKLGKCKIKLIYNIDIGQTIDIYTLK